jgi:glycosyltransferase involved in cell wall biosynthesis
MSPKVSVIVPNYNHAPYLKERLDSIFNQTYQDFEVVLLDDCSTDNSRDIFESYMSNLKVSHVIFNSVNSGSPFYQWEKGLSLSKGKYIWIAESDDSADMNFLKQCVEVLESSGAYVVQVDSILINDKNEQIGELSSPFEGQVSFNHVFKTIYWKRSIFFNASGLLFLNPNINRLPFNISKYKTLGDKMVYVSLFANKDVFFLKRIYNYHRLLPRSTSRLALKGKKISRDLEDLRWIYHSTYKVRVGLFNRVYFIYKYFIRVARRRCSLNE